MHINPPYHTNNATLAFALYAAGVPFPMDGDKPVPFTNIYDEDKIRELGYTGMTLENAVKQAVEDGRKGQFSYNFERVENLESLLAAFDDQQKLIEESTESAAEMMENLLIDLFDGNISRGEFQVRNACVMLKTRKLFVDGWKTYPPLIRVRNAGSPTTTTTNPKTGEKIVNHPGYRFISLGASKATRERLKL